MDCTKNVWLDICTRDPVAVVEVLDMARGIPTLGIYAGLFNPMHETSWKNTYEFYHGRFENTVSQGH